jgi:putative GTP pyrophosphokinase
MAMIRYTLPLASRKVLKEEYQRRSPHCEALIERIRNTVEDGLEAAQLRGTVKCRVKSFDSLYEKLLRKVRRAENSDSITVNDILGLRIVTPFLSDAGRVETFVEESFGILEKERKGPAGNGERFGYASTHYLCAVPEALHRAVNDGGSSGGGGSSAVGGGASAVGGACDRFEIQVRTILQDAWAEVEHELIYKSEDTPLNEPAKRKLAALNASLSLADIVFEEIRDQQRRIRSRQTQRRQDFMDRVTGTAAEDAESPPDLAEPESLLAGGEELDALLLKALHAHNALDFQAAVQTYTDILDREDRAYVRAVVYIHRGMANFARSEYSLALEDFTAALALDDDNWKALYYRGMTYRSQGRLQEALADLNHCVRLDTYRYESLLARAELLLEMGDPIGTRRDAHNALRLEPESREAQRLIARVQRSG